MIADGTYALREGEKVHNIFSAYDKLHAELSSLVFPPESPTVKSLAEELDGWDSVFKVKGFGKTIAELASYMAMLNVRRRAYLRMWSSISRIFPHNVFGIKLKITP